MKVLYFWSNNQFLFSSKGCALNLISLLFSIIIQNWMNRKICCLIVTLPPPREHGRPSNHIWHNSLPIIPFIFIFMMSLSLSPLLYELQTGKSRGWREAERWGKGGENKWCGSLIVLSLCPHSSQGNKRTLWFTVSEAQECIRENPVRQGPLK